MSELRKQVIEALKDRVVLDRQDKAALVNDIVNDIIVHDKNMYEAICSRV